MGLKSIEMQVAIPRTQDAGKMQEDAMRQNQQFQDKLTQNQLKQDQLKRKKVNEYDDVRKGDVSDEESNANDEEKERQQNDEKEQQVTHPYLGNKIDFSG